MLAKNLLDGWPAASWQHRRVLVGVSGGADSVALLCALSELAQPGQLLAAHYNHRWRGAASNADEAFVVHLCSQLGIKCIVEHATTPHPVDALPENQIDTTTCVASAMLAKEHSAASESAISLSKSEEVARDARYRFFTETAYERGASYVATAHTSDDRVETLLHNLFRGSGLAGAASLKMFRELDRDLVLVRPLIAKSRQAVLQYLEARGQGYCIDASNNSCEFARNYIRHEVLPAVRQRYRDADANLFNFSELVEEALGDIRQLAERWLAEAGVAWKAFLDEPSSASKLAVVSWRGDRFWVAPLTACAVQPWTVLREALRLVWLERGWPLGGMSRRHWDALRALVGSATELPRSDAQMSARQTLAVLPGGLVVETACGYLAIGRR